LFYGRRAGSLRIAAPQTILNAFAGALAPLGIDHIDMPATPERIWCAIRTADRQAKVS
jgi:aerobic carbon-monoxide dehydrogenase large subunit